MAISILIVITGCLNTEDNTQNGSFPSHNENRRIVVPAEKTDSIVDSKIHTVAAIPVLPPEEALRAQRADEWNYVMDSIVSLQSNVSDLNLGMPVSLKPKIVCWGDSLTAQGGWTDELADLCDGVVYNSGTGGEDAKTIMARQGGDVMTINCNAPHLSRVALRKSGKKVCFRGLRESVMPG